MAATAEVTVERIIRQAIVEATAEATVEARRIGPVIVEEPGSAIVRLADAQAAAAAETASGVRIFQAGGAAAPTRASGAAGLAGAAPDRAAHVARRAMEDQAEVVVVVAAV